MKSAVIKNLKIETVEKNKPTLKEKGAIVKVFGCGLCGSDIVKINHATLDNEDKIVLGHEIVGEIVDINTEIIGAGANAPFKKGDIIAMGHHYPCFECHFCKLGHHSMCKTFKSSNLYPSGFSEYVYITEGHLKNTVFKKPDNLSNEEISFLEPLSCCVRSIRRAGLELNRDNSNYNVLVIGLGSIGIIMTQAIKAHGANVFGFDINNQRQEFVKKYGIEFNKDLKYDVIFMTSGNNKAIATAMKYAELGAKIVVFSSISTDDGYKNDDIYYKELTVMGSYSPAPIDFRISYELLKAGKVDVKNLSTNYKLDNLEKAVNDTKQGKILKAYIEL